MAENPGAITLLLEEVRLGRAGAQSRLLDVVYSELHRMAAHYMASERPGHELQATALINETWLRLFGNGPMDIADQHHFFRASAVSMRRVLVDYARQRLAQKRGGGPRPVELEEWMQIVTASPDWQLDLNAGFQRLHELDARQAEVMGLMLFGGRDKDQIAQIMGMSKRTVERDILSATLFLKRFLATERNDAGTMAAH